MIMDNKGLFDAPEPIFHSDAEQLTFYDIDPHEFEDIAQGTTAAIWRSISWTGSFLSGTVTYDSRTAQPATDGYQVLDSAGTAQSDWSICPVVTAPPRHQFNYSVAVYATPPATPKVSGNFRLRYRGGTSTAVFVDTTAIWSHMTGGRTLQGRITFYEAAVSGITVSDFEVITSTRMATTGWDITNVSSSAVSAGQYITVTATPPEDENGDFRLQLKANSTRRGSENYPPQPIFSIASYVDDRVATATVATASWSHVTGGQFLRGRITFSGATVTTVSSSDFEIINAAGRIQSNWCIHINRTATTSSLNYITVTANPPSGQNASFRIRLKANSVRSGGADEDNAPAEAQSTALTAVDSRSPASPVVAGATWSNITGGSRLSANLTFTGADVIHIGPEDFQVLNSANVVQSTTTPPYWTITVSSSSVTAGNFILVTAVPPDNTDDDFKLRLKGRSVRSGGSATNNSPLSDEDTTLESVDTSAQVPVFTFGNIRRIVGTSRDVSITLTVTGATITGLTALELRVGNRIAGETGYITTFIGTSEVYDIETDRDLIGITEGDTITAIATYTIFTTIDGDIIGTTRIDGYVSFRFLANTVRVMGSTIDNYPEQDIVSDRLYINTRNGWGVTGGRVLQGFVNGVTGAPAVITDLNTQLSILNDQNQPVSGWRTVVTRSGDGSSIISHPPANTNGLFKYRLHGRSLFAQDRSRFPLENTDSEYVVIDTISVIAGATWSNEHYCTTSGKLQATLTFSNINVTDIEISDFEVIGAIAGHNWTFDAPPSSASAGTGILIAATPPNNTNGSFGFRIKVASVRSVGATFNNSPSVNRDSDRVTVDNRPATVSDGSWSNISGGVVLSGRMTFTTAAVAGIEDDDFAVLDSNNMEQSGWLIDVSASFTTAGGFVDVTATPPLGTSGDFKLQLDATSVMSGGSNINNAPDSNIISGERAIDTTGLIVTWGTPVYCGTSNEVDSTISFSHDVTGFTASNIIVRNAGDTADVSGWSHVISGTGRTYTIESTPPARTNSIFRLRLPMNSVTFRPSETGPTHNADSPQFNVDNRAILDAPSAEFVIPNAVQTGTTTDISVSFGENVWILSELDFTITGYDPAPDKEVLAQNHQIRIRNAQETTPIFRLRNIPSAPSIVSITRSPLGPSTGPTDRWIIRLNRPFRDLTPNEVVYKTISTGPDISLNRNPIIVDSDYTLRITNPINASGTLNAVLRKYAVNAVDDNLRGPEVPQNSGSYAFDTIILPRFTIGEAYSSGDSTDTTALDEPLDEATVYIEIEIDQNATGLLASDFIVSGACGGSPLSIITENRKWRLPVHIPDADKGNMTIAIPSNVIDERNQPASRTFEFDRTTEGQLEQPYLVVSNLPTTEQTSNSFAFTVTAYVDGTMVNLENLEPSDFRITSPEGDITPTSVA